MRSCVRFSLLALIIALIAAAAAPAAQAAEEPAIETLVAVNCKVENCAQTETKVNLGAPFGEQTYVEPKPPTAKEAEEQGFLQAGGRVPFGVTDFKIATTGSFPFKKPTSVVEHLRTDVAPGLATNPFAVPPCKNFGTEVAPHFFTAPVGCEASVIGKQHATVFLETETVKPGIDLALEGLVYNLEPRNGLASEYGVALELPAAIAGGPGIFAHTLIEGNVEWGKQAKGTGAGDYHDYFEIDVSPTLPLVASRLSFEGTKGTGDFVTNATSCPGHNTTTLKLTDKEGATVKTEYTTPVGLMGCKGETDPFGETFQRLPFEPGFTLTSGSTTSDAPNEITAAATLPNNPKAIAQSQVNTGTFTLPEGMTLNPSAAAGLAACTVAQAHIHDEAFGVECPAASELGTVSLNVPTLPDGSLTGQVYLGGPVSGPETGPISGPPYIIYVVANSARYGVSVRLKGEVIPNEATGQVTTIFKENPEQPFTELALHFNRGALTSVANPLVCGTPAGSTTFTPLTGDPALVGTAFGVSVTGCANPIPFALSQSTTNQTANAGGNTSYTFSLTRPEGHQYLGAVKTTLPAGLVGQIPKATQCTEAQASAEPSQCPDTSQIGTASAIAGSGPTPFAFGGGKVYLTGPYQGAPFGLLITVPAVAGPFNLGEVKTRAKIDVDPYTARVTTTANIPTIKGGIPIRLRGVTVSINKQGFLLNPTSCTAMATESTVTSTFGATQNLSSPFQVGNCNLLKFKPAFKAVTSAKTSKANGASLETTLNEVPGQANVKSVKVQLPKALPSRLTTLQKACPAATFEADYRNCPSGSFVGGARANTPTLTSKLKGPAILVSHAAAAFPDLDLVMEADGVRSILVGNTDIKNGITTTTFASTPDVPVSSITVNLPIGSHSALTANANLCRNPLVMPTTMTGQNGTVVKQNTRIKVNGCGVRIVGRRVVGNTAYITVQTFAAGRISGKGSGLSTRFRRLSRPQKKVTLKIPLSSRGRNRHRPFNVKVRVGFVPKAKGAPSSSATVTVRF